MMATAFDPAVPPRVGTPRSLFELAPDINYSCAPVRCHDVAPDGQRFFWRQARPAAPRLPVTHINLVLNWFEELKAKVPRQ